MAPFQCKSVHQIAIERDKPWLEYGTLVQSVQAIRKSSLTRLVCLLTLSLRLTRQRYRQGEKETMATDTSASSKAKAKTIVYFVNGERQTTEERKLTPRAMLTAAGFVPPEDYRFIRVDGGKESTDLDREEPIHPDEEFQALFKGATPVS